MTAETVPVFDVGAQHAAQVRHAVATCASELRELAGAGLKLSAEQTDELRVLLATVAPTTATTGKALRARAAAVSE